MRLRQFSPIFCLIDLPRGAWPRRGSSQPTAPDNPPSIPASVAPSCGSEIQLNPKFLSFLFLLLSFFFLTFFLPPFLFLYLFFHGTRFNEEGRWGGRWGGADEFSDFASAADVEFLSEKKNNKNNFPTTPHSGSIQFHFSFFEIPILCVSFQFSWDSIQILCNFMVMGLRVQRPEVAEPHHLSCIEIFHMDHGKGNELS